MNSKRALLKLKEIVGEDVYKEIINEIGGSTVYFPEENEWPDRDERNLLLKEDYYSGMYDVVELANKYNLSVSTVYKLVQSR